VSSLPTGQWSIIATAVLLSPILAFLMAIAVEILIGSLMDSGVPALLAFVAVSALGWSAASQAMGPAARKRPSRDVSPRGEAEMIEAGTDALWEAGAEVLPPENLESVAIRVFSAMANSAYCAAIHQSLPHNL
jgi:hypothetical protein